EELELFKIFDFKDAALKPQNTLCHSLSAGWEEKGVCLTTIQAY
ncbi:MAG: hypothetical protein ACI9CF_001448, partial [Candidatus Omnitrophota bacterium]